MTDYEIAKSVDFELDEWTEYANDYCEGTGHKVEDLFSALLNVGFEREDVIHLENLSDRRVLQRVGERHGEERRYLRRNDVDHVQLYMHTMADLLEEAKV